MKLCLSVLSSLNVKQGGFKLIEDNPVVEEKIDNIVRTQVDGLEKDTDIEKSTVKKTNTNEKENTKSIETDMTNTK